MPVQTTKKNVNLADGCRVSVKASESSAFIDLGVMEGDYVATLQYNEERKEWANAAPDIIRSDMRMEGSFTLANLDFDGLAKISNDMITRTVTAGTKVLSAAFDEQVIDGFTPNVPVELSAVVTATGLPIKFSAAPVIASIVDNDTVQNTLTADDDYFIIADANASSGYKIMFTDEGVDTTAKLTITFGDNTPIASETMTAGTSSFEAQPYAMRVQHLNSSGTVDYQLDLYNVYTSPGSYNFGLKGADTGGYDTMEISFSVELDETKTDGAQLFSVTKNV